MNLDAMFAARECFGIDCVLFATGRVVILASEQICLSEQPRPVVTVKAVAESSMAGVLKHLERADLSPLTTLFRVEGEAGTLQGGESSWGSDGWLSFHAARNATRPEWLLFLTNSNPFVTGSLEHRHATVQNNHGQSFSVPLDKPESLSTV